jgi:hypothetical protein
MDIDFTALASRVAARGEVLGCVILSRDGLILGAFPPGGERDVIPAWLRFSSVGEPDRGFVEFSGELWAFVSRGAYAAFAVGTHRTRAGILLDYLEQALLAAEDSREMRAAVRAPLSVDLNRERFGIVVPAEGGSQALPVPSAGGSADAGPGQQSFVPAQQRADFARAVSLPSGTASPPDMQPPPVLSPSLAPQWGHQIGPLPEVSPLREPGPEPEPDPAPEFEPGGPVIHEDDIDRVALAREFAELLQDGPFTVEEGQ